jgi:hypothetical protein
VGGEPTRDARLLDQGDAGLELLPPGGRVEDPSQVVPGVVGPLFSSLSRRYTDGGQHPMTSPSLPPESTPFDRTADTRPLLSILVDQDAVAPEDRASADRVLALAELPSLDVRARRGNEGWHSHDLIVVSQPPGGPMGASHVVTPATALDLVRLLLVNLGLFCVRRDLGVNEGLYYLYRYKSVFRHNKLRCTNGIGALGTKNNPPI